MILRNISFDLDSMPKTVTVEMTIREAVAIADVAGSAVGGDRTSASVYRLLSGVANAYWENGMTEAIHSLNIEQWKFKKGARDYV